MKPNPIESTRSKSKGHNGTTGSDTNQQIPNRKNEYCVDMRLAEISEFAIVVEANSQEEAESKAIRQIKQEHPDCGCSGCPYHEVSVMSSWPIERKKNAE